jgi:hypothetical protein
MATKAPCQQPTPVIYQPTVSQLLHSRPWLTRPQPVSKQDRFIIHCRDNLVPGATGPKDWFVVTAEFNQAFKDELRRLLAWKTLSKRCGIAWKIYLSENEDYARILAYPVPEIDGEEDIEVDTDVHMGDEDVMNLPFSPPQPQTTHTSIQPEASNPPNPAPNPLTARSAYLTPGFYDPASISESYVAPLTRAKFHLRRRTSSPVSFDFLNHNEETLVKHDPQYVDIDILIANSPYYARRVQSHSNLIIIDVPEQFSARTVNIFIQVIAPIRATHLPDHYLWKAKKPVPGIFDQFGGIKVEKIVWTADVLLDLLFFAQILEVYWVVDMVIDRLHFLLTEQKRCDNVSRLMGNIDKDRADVTSRHVPGDSRVPTVKPHLARLTAEDFGHNVIGHVAVISRDLPTLRFMFDLLCMLGRKADAEWACRASFDKVKHVFIHASSEYLTNSTQEEHCKRYHHHNSASKTCYTSHASHSSAEIINALYTTVTPQEFINLSIGLFPRSSLSSTSSNDICDLSKLRKENSPPEMLQAEKMILEMESRMEKTKAALQRARVISGPEKQNAVREASKAAQDMYSPSEF